MKKILLLLLVLPLVVFDAQAQKLAKQMSAEACKCYNDEVNSVLRKLKPEELVSVCIKKAVEKYEKKLNAYVKGSKDEFDVLMTQTSLYIIECGGFDYLKNANGKFPVEDEAEENSAEAPTDTACAGMKDGVFHFISDDVDDYYIERLDSLQFEYWGDNMIETRVIWDSACKYHTAHVRTTSDAVRKKLTPGQGVVVAITKVEGDYYTVIVEGPDGSKSTIKYKKIANKEFRYIGK